MPNFAEMMKAPAGQAKKPKLLICGNFKGVVKSFEAVKAPDGKEYTSMMRFHLGLTEWPDFATEDDKMDDSSGTLKPIDLSKRQLRRDFYDNAVFRLDDFIRSCGIEPNGRSYEEVLPELIGAQVLIEVDQYLNPRTQELGNQVKNLSGLK